MPGNATGSGETMRILVLGGYGLIGLAVVRRLLAEGHEVVGLGRSAALGRRLCPEARWIGADLRQLLTPEDWRPHLAGIEVVVNAAGVLQSGGRDDVALIQDKAIRALILTLTAGGPRRFVQISAPGVSARADTAFYRTKAKADEALKTSGLDYTILRPGLVFAPQSYGGTGLLRMLAAVPWVQPLTLAGARIQTVHVEDVATAVLSAVEGKAKGVDADLVEPESHSLEEIVLGMRARLGFDAPKAVWRLPGGVGRLVGRGADLAGLLGWRSPLRTTAMRVLETDVAGDPSVWREQTGQEMRGFGETLRALPSTVQERVYARMTLLFPFLVLTLAAFWIASGIIGFLRLDQAAAVLSDVMEEDCARLTVALGGIADIVIGAGLLLRRWFRPAAFAAVGLSLVYLMSASLLTPELWGDPLGPLVKVIPAMMLALVGAALKEER